jgi:hypothetical protein
VCVRRTYDRAHLVEGPLQGAHLCTSPWAEAVILDSREQKVVL